MYATSDQAKRQMGVSPEELARVTATQCFQDADLNQDAKVSFEEFKQVMYRYWNHDKNVEAISENINILYISLRK